MAGDVELVIFGPARFRQMPPSRFRYVVTHNIERDTALKILLSHSPPVNRNIFCS
jgi:hypothetical protein